MNMTGSQLRTARKKMGLSQAKLSELTGISQHVLSAFELGKNSISKNAISSLIDILADEQRIASIQYRKKRYQEHTYDIPPILPIRAMQIQQTKENIHYRKILDDLWDHHKSAQKTLTALSLFSGCGGFSLGFSAAGFNIAGYVEIEKGLSDIYTLNFPNAIQIGSDILNVSDTTLSNFVTKFGKIDIIIGGPPCQGFSLAGKRDVNDPRNRLFEHYLRSINIVRPKVAVLENVRLLTSMKSQSGDPIKNEIVNLFRECGYAVKMFEINAKDYGVPQHRERVLFIAIRNDLNKQPTLPARTHGHKRDLLVQKEYRTFADACSDLPYIESGQISAEDELHAAVAHPDHVIRWLWDVPQGGSAHDNKDINNRPPSGYNTTYKRQIWTEPAATVQTTFGMISGCRNVHPIATRSLTIREAARIQSFPDQFHFTGTLGCIRKGIGNAVPPLLAFILAEHIKLTVYKSIPPLS